LIVGPAAAAVNSRRLVSLCVMARALAGDPSPSAREGAALLPAREILAPGEQLRGTRRLTGRKLILGAIALAFAALLGAAAVLASGRARPAPRALGRVEREHPALTALYGPAGPAVDNGQLVALKASLRAAMTRHGVVLPANSFVPMKAETLVTADKTSTSAPLRSLFSGAVVHIVAVWQQPGAEAKLRGKLAQGGWVTIMDLRSLHSFVDGHAWPAGCPTLGQRPTGHYIVAVDETPVTLGPLANTAAVAMLSINQQVDVDQLTIDQATGIKIRGRLTGGAGWFTISDLVSCDARAGPLPAPKPRALPPAPQRKGSFLVIGDWGWDPSVHWTVKTRQCQETIAINMLRAFIELGDVRFVVNVGDSFYPNGVTSAQDPQWQAKWRDVYAEQLRSVPWYSVYGNHDLHADPCACTEDDAQCAQVNPDVTDRSRFYMPAPSFHVDHPELNTEVVGLDLNMVGDGNVCNMARCPDACRATLWRRHVQARNLLNWRVSSSPYKNLVVFSHYPTDYLSGHPDILGPLRDQRHNILYLGGHRHSTDSSSVLQIWPHQSWVVGGGGGLSCDGPQGFLVGEIDANDNIKTYPIHVPPGVCCA